MDNPVGTQIMRGDLRVGTRVDVHTRYELGRWAPGFTIAEVQPDGYRIRRASDGAVLNETIRADEIRVVSPVPARLLESELQEGTQSDGLRRLAPNPRIGMDQ
jgi:hypothetical protein